MTTTDIIWRGADSFVPGAGRLKQGQTHTVKSEIADKLVSSGRAEFVDVSSHYSGARYPEAQPAAPQPNDTEG